MKRFLALCAAALACGLALLQGRSAAQPPLDRLPMRPMYDVYNRSNVTPYLNLTRGGNPAANYYLGVLPEIDRRNFEARSQEDLDLLFQRTARRPRDLVDPLLEEPIIPRLPRTGHPTAFQSFGTFYPLGRR
jgi:hypothetical protein